MSTDGGLCECGDPTSDHVRLGEPNEGPLYAGKKVVVPCRAKDCSCDRLRWKDLVRIIPASTGIKPGMAWPGGPEGYRVLRLKPREPPAPLRPTDQLPVYAAATGVCPKCHPERGAKDVWGKATVRSIIGRMLALQQCEACGHRWLEGNVALVLETYGKGASKLKTPT